MKIGSRSYLTLGFILTSGLTGLGQSAVAASSETSLTVTIHVQNFAEVDQKALMEAEKVATGVFRKAGVETRWIDPALSSENGQEKSTGEGMLNLSHIQLNILPPLMAERLGLPNNVMGLAPGTEPDRQRVYVFYDKVKALAESQMRARVSGGISTHAIRVEILGHAIVHEIGHVLLNLESHSDTGIMRANWDLKQLQDACYGYLVFTPAQAEAIRLEVARRSSKAQTNGGSSHTETLAPIPEPDTGSYTVFGATSSQEAALRTQIRLMHPEVLPLRVFFVPHWKYLDNARIFHLLVPTGYRSLMFTHFPFAQPDRLHRQ